MLCRRRRKRFPAGKNEWDDPAARLVEVATTDADGSLQGAVKQWFGLYSDPAKGAALAYFLQLRTAESLKTFRELLVTCVG